MCVGSVCPPSGFLKIPFRKSGSSVQTAPRIVDWQDRLTLDPPEWAEWTEWSVNSPPLCRLRGRQECFLLSDWGVLLLDVIMNIAVIIYSWHLSCWRRRELTLLSFWRECGDPDLPKCVYVCANHSWSSFIYRRSEYKGFLWIFMNLVTPRKRGAGSAELISI